MMSEITPEMLEAAGYASVTAWNDPYFWVFVAALVVFFLIFLFLVLIYRTTKFYKQAWVEFVKSKEAEYEASKKEEK